MNIRRLVVLKILVCAIGGAALLPSFMWLSGVILPSDDRVSVADIPVLAGMGVVYGLFSGILWVCRHRIVQNRMAKDFCPIATVLIGVYSFINGISLSYIPKINFGAIILFFVVPTALFAWHYRKQQKLQMEDN